MSVCCRSRNQLSSPCAPTPPCATTCCRSQQQQQQTQPSLPSAEALLSDLQTPASRSQTPADTGRAPPPHLNLTLQLPPEPPRIRNFPHVEGNFATVVYITGAFVRPVEDARLCNAPVDCNMWDLCLPQPVRVCCCRRCVCIMQWMSLHKPSCRPSQPPCCQPVWLQHQLLQQHLSAATAPTQQQQVCICGPPFLGRRGQLRLLQQWVQPTTQRAQHSSRARAATPLQPQQPLFLTNNSSSCPCT